MAINAADTRRTTHPPGVMTAGSRQVRSAIAKYARYICQMSAYTHPAKESYAAMQPPNTKPPNTNEPAVTLTVTMSDTRPGTPLTKPQREHGIECSRYHCCSQKEQCVSDSPENQIRKVVTTKHCVHSTIHGINI